LAFLKPRYKAHNECLILNDRTLKELRPGKFQSALQGREVFLEFNFSKVVILNTGLSYLGRAQFFEVAEDLGLLRTAAQLLWSQTLFVVLSFSLVLPQFTVFKFVLPREFFASALVLGLSASGSGRFFLASLEPNIFLFWLVCVHAALK
jgi:hypothetical protein